MELKQYEIELLAEGNISVFAELYCKKYPKIAKANGFTEYNRRAWLEFNKEEQLFTIWLKNGNKQFFDVKFEFIGEKEY